MHYVTKDGDLDEIQPRNFTLMAMNDVAHAVNCRCLIRQEPNLPANWCGYGVYTTSYDGLAPMKVYCAPSLDAAHMYVLMRGLHK